MQDIANLEAARYGCAIGFAYHTSDGTKASYIAGAADNKTGVPAKVTDRFAWGSITKPFTGASIMALIESGAFDLDSRAAPLVDGIIARMADAAPGKGYGRSMVEIWGEEAAKVTIRELMGMKSGVPEFDTAKGGGGDDPFRKEVYARADHVFAPMELFNLSWVRGKLRFPPGEDFNYSSTGFMLLGLILAEYNKAQTWTAFNQSLGFPPALRASFSSVRYGADRPPSTFSDVRGYDRTSYNDNTGSIDVTDTMGVFAGWTASDMSASVSDVAELAWYVYGLGEGFINETSKAALVPAEDAHYGLATFDMTFTTGIQGPEGRSWGHKGATYGFDSALTWHPVIKTAIAAATSIETDHQAQPADVVCNVFNTLYNYDRGMPRPVCTYTSSHYSHGDCNCTIPAH